MYQNHIVCHVLHLGGSSRVQNAPRGVDIFSTIGESFLKNLFFMFLSTHPPCGIGGDMGDMY